MQKKYLYVDDSNEKWIKSQYDRILKKDIKDYCLLSITLKNFDEYTQRIGRAKSEAAINLCANVFMDNLKEDEYIARLHDNYFLILLICPMEEAALHDRALPFHYAIRDAMEQTFGKKLYIEMGFFPIIDDKVDFYTAKYLSDLTRTHLYREYPETTYEMYYLNYNDQKMEFLKYEDLVNSAIENGDFKLYLQPKVNLKTGKVVYAEALLRWIDPQLGMIPLSSFLPNLEENGTIRVVDLHLFEIACQYLEKWKHQYGKDISISFNMSQAYFGGPYFMPEYTEVFERYNLTPDCVQIELLESVVLNEMERLKPLVKSIYDYGFTCALDDFGSGFSSFDILTSVELTTLKIDRSLFKDIHNERERKLIKNIIKIAHDLDMEVVAEGIETQEYAQYLKEIGCDFIQGYFYYKPMPIDEFEEKFILNDEQVTL